MLKPPISIAIVGCGRISRNHVKAISTLCNKGKLVALVDIDENNKEELLEYINELKLDIPDEKLFENIASFSSYDEFLGNVKLGILSVDLVVLTTPSGLHSKQTIQAAELGINVCTEKPMATNWADGIKMHDACERSGVKLFVVKQNRFNPTLQLLKKQVEIGRFGKLALVTVNVFWQRPQSYYDSANWRGTLKYDGGALMNQASHYIDLLDWIVGPVQSVFANVATLGRNIEAEDTASLQLRWKDGALGTMAVTMLTYPKNLEGSITILGDSGTVKIGGTSVNKLETWEFDTQSEDDDLAQNISYETTSVYGHGHKPYYENMIQALMGEGIPICDSNEGLKSLELLTAAYSSAKSNRLVKLPLKRE